MVKDKGLKVEGIRVSEPSKVKGVGYKVRVEGNGYWVKGNGEWAKGAK